MNQELIDFIKQHRTLFWYTPEDKKEDISEELLIETILNYGDINALKKMLDLLGTKKTANIFFQSINQSERRKNNYQELTINYFTIFFKRYAS